MLSTSAAVGTTAWVAPSVLTLDRIAAAAGSCTAETPVVSGNVTLLTSPPATESEVESDTHTFVWLERESEVLDNDLIVNRSVPGNNFGPNGNEMKIIPAGTEISSYLVHGDRVDNSGSLSGSLTFGTPEILGIIYKREELEASEFLASPVTTFTAEPQEGPDRMTLSLAAGNHSVSWSMNFGAAGDNLRIIVSC